MNIAFFFFFLLIPLVNTQSWHCPSRCMCVPDSLDRERLLIACKWDRIAVELRPFAHLAVNYTKTLTIECTSGIETLPSEFNVEAFSGFGNLRELRIQDCPMQSLPTGLFNGLNELRSLHIKRLGLPQQPLILDVGLFDGLHRLEKLSMLDSHIQSFPPGTLCSLGNLQVLNVSGNWLNNVSTGIDGICRLNQLVIADYSKNRIKNVHHNDLVAFVALRELLLNGNEIYAIASTTFRENTLIQRMNLANNHLEELPTLPENILYLNAAENRLSIIPTTATSLKNLLTLNLSGNAIDDNSPFPLESASLEMLDLSNNNLAQIPNTLFANCKHLIVLRLSNNKITRIDLALSNHTHLQELSLASNHLTELTSGSFDNLEELVQLDLANNSIFRMEFNVFDHSEKLADLIISHNVLIETPMAISKLAGLKKLDFSHNQISKTYKFLFNKMQYLQRLDLSNNKIPNLGSYVLSDLPRLSSLDLSHNKIDLIASNAFAKCPKLRMLNLGYNFISSFNGTLASSNSLKKLNSSGNLLEKFDWKEMPKSLAELYLDGNRITELGPAEGSSVKHVQLQNNLLVAIDGAQIPNTIETLNLSANVIRTLAPLLFISKAQIRVVDLRDNRLTSLSENEVLANNSAHEVHLYAAKNPFICSCEMNWLKRTRSTDKTLFKLMDAELADCTHRIYRHRIKLANVAREELLCPYTTLCETECICCQFSNCDCKSTCPIGCQCFYDSAFDTNIVRCTGMNENDRINFKPKMLPMYATHVYLDRVNMTTIESHDFLGRIRLRQLYVNGSSIKEIKAFAFNTLSALQLLDLSGNRLRRLNGDEMHKLHRLTHLSLNNNELTAIGDQAINALPSLQFINLHGNQFKEVPRAVVNITSSLTALSIGDNPFRCDCSQRFSTQKWLWVNQDKVIDAQRVSCVENVTWAFRHNDTTVLSAYPPNINEDIFQMPMLQFIELENKSICIPAASGIFGSNITHSRLLMGAVFLATLLVLLGLICIAISLFRRTHTAREQRRYTKAPPSLNNSTTPGCSPTPLLTYDVFVSYAKADEHIVNDQLCRKLEAEDYTLCLLYRDVPNSRSYNDQVPVHRINNDMITKMEHSNSLIIVLTRNFIENEWQMVQIRTAHQCFMKQIVKNKKLIVILDDQLELDKLDAELGHMLRKSTCIRWNESLLWTKLLQALPIRTSTISDSSQIYSDLYGSIVPSDIV